VDEVRPVLNGFNAKTPGRKGARIGRKYLFHLDIAICDWFKTQLEVPIWHFKFSNSLRQSLSLVIRGTSHNYSNNGGKSLAPCSTRAISMPFPAGAANVFGQLHDIGVIVGLVTAAIQLLKASRKVALQRGELPLFERVRFNPPAEEFDLFIRVKLDCRSLDFFHRIHVQNVSQPAGCCPQPCRDGRI
jgi:hypothetical protein